ncbi:hypothetical protein [Mesorhizobium sophorae]|uniref:hypothetical protein n=1 Tax=Mesorhizobium sophorae TaxID=1300294 RepID=UPI00142E915B|nr:hypothetical protein [Mesorhizobium sophorae]
MENPTKGGYRYAPFHPVFGITFDWLHDSTTRRGSTRTANRVYIEREQRQQ